MVHDKETWLQLVAAGEPVFSANELQRLQEACAGMNEVEKLQFAMAALEIKTVMPGAYVRRGGEVK